MMSPTRVRVAALLAVVALAAPAVVHAESMEVLQPNGRAALASTAGLDLSRDADARVMVGRIHAAAKRVCQPDRLGVASAEVRLCREAAVSQAVARLQAPRVTAAAQTLKHARFG